MIKAMALDTATHCTCDDLPEANLEGEGLLTSVLRAVKGEPLELNSIELGVTQSREQPYERNMVSL